MESFLTSTDKERKNAMKFASLIVSVTLVAAFLSVPEQTYARNSSYAVMQGSTGAITISATPTRVSSGDTVKITVEVNGNVTPHAEILIPDKGVSSVALTHVRQHTFSSRFVVSRNDPQGLYAIQTWIGGSGKRAAVAKASFLYKKLIGDFCIMGVFNPRDPEQDMNNYIRQMKGFGANFIIATSFITSHKVYYKSKICNTAESSAADQSYIGDLLKCADENGIPVMLSASWDMTRDIPYTEYTKSTMEIIKELYNLYGSHPSLVGFYVEQEGSGIYYAPLVRKFCRYVKKINPGLLTACAPYMDNALLAGYLSDIRSLDIIIYQGMTMASYRRDNRLKFPLRRVKDFGSVSSGAKQLQNKIALTHVETFGFGENRVKGLYLTGYNNIYQQILSAATVPGNDGITMWNYNDVIYNTLREYPQYRKEILASRQAVFDGMKAFELIGKASKDQNQLAVYYPYTDWQEYRWERHYYSALDAFRMMGIPVDVLPYAPPHSESYPPYWPFHANRHVLKRLLKEKEVLVLPSVSGFQATDSQLMKHLLTEGGTIIAFGSRVPMGRTYDRAAVFGIEKTGKMATHLRLKAEKGFGGEKPTEWNLGRVTLPVWKSTGAKVIAKFDDGSPALTMNKYGRGTAVAFMTDLKTAARRYPDLVRDVLNRLGVQRYVDIIGTNENCDVAVSRTRNGFIAAVVNHNNKALHITLRPLMTFKRGTSQDWLDVVSRKIVARMKDDDPLKITVKPLSYRLIKMNGAGAGR